MHAGTLINKYKMHFYSVRVVSCVKSVWHSHRMKVIAA